MAVATYTKSGAKSSTPSKLNKEVFEVDAKNHHLLKQAYTRSLNSSRTASAVTKKRGEVSGGGRKPYRQKGTGRARFGSSRNPIWRGGGVTFGPTGNENYEQKLNAQARKLALRQALSSALKENRLRIIDSFELKESKTAAVSVLLNKLNASGRILLVCGQKETGFKRATSNLKDTKLISANYLNAFEVMNADVLVLDKPALDYIHEWLGGKK